MVLESAQLLSDAHRFYDADTMLAIYRPLQGHRNHPCSIWTRDNGSNYAWLWALAMELAAEYTLRYGKRHASTDMIEGPLRILPKTLHLDTPRSPFAQVVPDEFKALSAVHAYRQYYIADKMRFAKWERGGRTVPHWVMEK